METNYTKGKWHLMVGGFSKKGDTPNMIQVYATNDDLEMICKVHKDELLQHSNQNFQANALLISKAPEMLEMLQKMKYHLEPEDKDDFEMYNEIVQLIKEATEL